MGKYGLVNTATADLGGRRFKQGQTKNISRPASTLGPPKATTTECLHKMPANQEHVMRSER